MVLRVAEANPEAYFEKLQIGQMAKWYSARLPFVAGLEAVL
jgi:hypothetical protein